MFEYILENFCVNSKFVNDIDGVTEYLKSLEITNEEQIEILEAISSYNEKMRSFM